VCMMALVWFRPHSCSKAIHGQEPRYLMWTALQDHNEVIYESELIRRGMDQEVGIFFAQYF